MAFHFSIPIFTNLLVNRVLPENDSALLLQGLAIVLVVVAGVAAAQYLQTMMMLRIESITDLRLQTAVFDRVMRLPMRFVSRYTTGDLASRANSISQLRQVLGRRPFHLAVSCLQPRLLHFDACLRQQVGDLGRIVHPGLTAGAAGSHHS